jgi:hypothetical protein
MDKCGPDLAENALDSWQADVGSHFLRHALGEDTKDGRASVEDDRHALARRANRHVDKVLRVLVVDHRHPAVAVAVHVQRQVTRLRNMCVRGVRFECISMCAQVSVHMFAYVCDSYTHTCCIHNSHRCNQANILATYQKQ